jgi:hypothetical protein
MKILPAPGFLIIVLSLAFPANAQDNNALIYGLDPLLYNGRTYAFTLSYGTIGHPFLNTPSYESGYVIIRDEKFNDILLNYDIYNQELILKYKDLHGAFNFIKLSKAWLRGFYLHGDAFVLIESEDGQKQFFQVIGQNGLQVLYQWQKKMSLSMQTGSKNYQFSDPEKTMYLYSNKEFYRFKNNKSFIAYFIPSQQDYVKKYLAQNKINVKKASDEKMLKLITFCSRIEH